MSISKATDQDPSRFVADDDDAEEVLSLCDMPLFGDADVYSFSSSSSSSDASVSSSVDEFFEFSPAYDGNSPCGSDRPGPFPGSGSREILFCGKTITYTEARSASNLRTNGCRDESARKSKTGVTKKAKARTVSYMSARCDKWYMLAFGLARFPSEMAMSDIRRRQGKGNRGAVVESGTRKGKEGGVWWMVKAFGRSRREDEGVVDAGAMVKASFGCIPRL
ncbi:hypothetical protein MLD38_003722 [Melastoma candidum]|uniref:Uncharacterized protein n=1 Tax=Melastoma candidum TaxID=119954 RepID=A0ACB9S4U7_9MYRT|nr:hypothetical protein MLD38_003722 [Melastoma candidum]